MASQTSIYFLILVGIVYTLYYYSWASRKQGRDLPHGPPGFPVFGNIFDFRGSVWHLKLTEWSRQYGDLFTYRIGQASVIVLSSPEAVKDLYVKKGQTYSSRPQTSNQASLITQGVRIVNMPYGDLWREHRRVVHSLLGTQNAKIFLPFQEYESRQMLKNLLDEPNAFWHEVVRYSGSVTFSMLLGCRFDRSDAFIPQQIGKNMQVFFANIRPGAWLVDWIPALDVLPDILAPWRKQAVAVREQIMPFYRVFHQQMKERVLNGTAPDCFVARVLQEQKGNRKWSEAEYSHLIAELLTAGTETTATTLQWFFKAAVLFPDPVHRTQEEIDRVVGRQRLPSWEDQANLPYLRAFVEELHRWASATPMAFLHATSEADTYRGKYIPKGATVVANFYSIHQNPAYYPEPDKFIPERFLDDPKLEQFAFGIGRRECPGQHVANASLYIGISRILWAFNIKPKRDAPPPSGYTGAFPVVGPAVFECVLEPRDDFVATVINANAAGDRPKEMEDSSIYDNLHANM